MFLMQMMLVFWMELKSETRDWDRTETKKDKTEVKGACAAEIGNAKAGAELVQ